MTPWEAIKEAERLERIAIGHYEWARGLQARADWFTAVGDANSRRAQALRDAVEALP